MEDLEHLGDISQDDMIFTELLFDHTAMIILNLKNIYFIIIIAGFVRYLVQLSN